MSKWSAFMLVVVVSVFALAMSFAMGANMELSDQGTGAKFSGSLVDNGDLTVQIWDAATGGSLIWSATYIDAINNGSWNLMLGQEAGNPLSLEYGQKYWKDYQINSNDLDFINNSGSIVERLEFYSPLGYINDNNLFNFSMISPCSAGYAIRSINTGGSVVCEKISEGAVASGWNDTGTVVGLITSTDNVNANTLYVDNTNGKVGIGTASPGYPLDIKASSSNQDLFRLSHPTSPTEAGFMIGFSTDGTTNDNVVSLGIEYSSTDYDVINIQRSTRNVGIGTTAPGAKLDVEGNLMLQYGAAINEFSTDTTLAGNSDLAVPTEKAIKTYVDAHAGSGLTGTGTANYITKWTGTTSVGNSVIYETGGNIGIGTSSPGEKLDVAGDIRVLNSLIFKDPHGTTDIYRTISASIGHTDVADTALYAIIIHPTNSTTPADMLSMRLHGYNYDSDFNIVDVKINGYLYSNGGLSTNQGWRNYGTTPVDSVKSYKRDSDGKSATVVTFGRLLDYPQLALDVLSGYSSNVDEADDWDLIITNDLTGYTYVSTVTERQIYEAYSSHIWRIDQNEKMRINSGGNVGIGTTGPESRLHLAGSGAATFLIKPTTMSGGTSKITFADPDSGTGPMSIEYNDDGTPDLAITGGNVGIGTTSPGAKLDVEGNLILQYGTAINEFSTDTTLSENSDLAVPTEKAIKTYVDAHAGSGLSGTGTSNYITKWTGTTSVGNSVIYETGGNIGIGTSSPSQRLSVSGSIFLTGDIYGGRSGESGIWRFSTTYPNYGIIYTDSSPDYISFSPGGGGTSTPDFKVSGTGDAIVKDDVWATDYCNEAGSVCRDIETINTENFGILGSNLDWNTLTDPGAYGISQTSFSNASNDPNATFSGIYPYGVLIIEEGYNGYGITQTYCPHTGSSSSYCVRRTGWNNANGWQPWVKLWDSNSDGSGSGLDADLLDGHDSSYFQAAITNPITGTGNSGYLSKFTGTNTIGNSPVYTNGTNVGIGTTAVNEKLTVASGSIKLYSLQNTADAYRYIGTEYNSGNGNNRAEIRFAIDGADTKTRLSFHTANGAGTINEQMRITSAGNVGIGTTSPSDKLHVMGDLRLTTSSSDTNADSGSIKFFGGGGNPSVGPRIYADNTASYGRKDLVFMVHDGADYISESEAMRITYGGNVGIGTTSPTYKLHVNGTLYADTVNTGQGANELYAMNQNVRTTDAVTFATIDTGSGAKELGDAAVTDGDTNSIPTNDQVYDFVTGYVGSGGSGDIYVNEAGDNMTGDLDMNSNDIYELGFAQAQTLAVADTYSNGQSNLPSGNSMYVQDDIKVGGNIQGAAGDVAENVFTTEELEAGDVVVINDDLTVEKSSKPYDSGVAGIISTDPAYILASERDGLPLALTGIVPVKVTNESGQIKPRDLLTTSSKPGYAMKCNDKQKCQGAILAKAMGTLNGSEGIIDALVMLG